MENIATVQRIKNVRVHPNADSLDIVQVLGWDIVVKRNEFKEDDKCLYIVIDSILPEKTEFEFLRNKNFRIKPIRLRGQPSNGICFPLSVLPESDYSEGQDVTDIVGCKHYEKPMPASLMGSTRGNIPGFIIITDELNLRSYPDAIDELKDKPFYISLKYDGSSSTFYLKDGEFGVCSRRINLKEDETNGFWKVAKKYNIKEILEKEFPNKPVAIQGECYGEGIQKNPLGLKGIDIAIFNLFDIQSRSFYSLSDLENFCNRYSLPMVKVIEKGNNYNYSVNDLINISNATRYPNGSNCEGIVIRPSDPFHSFILNKQWSAKVISESYKEKE